MDEEIIVTLIKSINSIRSMVCAIRGGEFRGTGTSMLINPLIIHANVGRIDLRTPQGAA